MLGEQQGRVVLIGLPARESLSSMYCSTPSLCHYAPGRTIPPRTVVPSASSNLALPTSAAVYAVSLAPSMQGKLVGQAPTPRAVGTTVAVKDLFKTLPVRHKAGHGQAGVGVWATQQGDEGGTAATG